MTDEDRTISREELARLSAAGTAPVVRARLHIDGRSPHEVTGRTVIGREPDAEADTVGIVLSGDPLVSKAHIAFDVAAGGLVAIDLGSSNGTSIVVGGESSTLSSAVWTPVPDGTVVVVGDTSLRVELVGVAGGPAEPMMTPPPGFASAGVISAVPAAVLPVCAQCGRASVAGSRFCDGCGASTAASPPAGPPVAVSVASAQTVSPTMSWPADPVGAPPPLGPPVLPGGGGGESSKRKWLLVGAGIAGVVAVAGVAFVVLSGGDDGAPTTGGLPTVPSQVEEQWSIDIDGADDVTGDSSAVFVMSIVDGDAEVYAVAGGSGEERWTADVANDVEYGAFQGLTAGVVLGTTCDFDAVCEAFGLDVGNGEVLWTDEQSGNMAVSSSGSVLLSEDGSVELIDPSDGKRLERVRGDLVDSDGTYVYVRDDDEVEVFDTKDLSSVFGPVQVDDEAIGTIYAGGKLITAVGEELVVINADGEVDRESQVPADEIYQIRPGPDGMVLVGTDDGVLGLDPVDGRAAEIWSVDGSLNYTFVTEVGLLVLVTEGDDDGSDAEIIDARTGDSRITLRDYYESSQSLGSNGMVNSAYQDESDIDAAASQYSDGEEIWSLGFNGNPFLIDGAVVEVDDGQVTLYR